MCALEWNRSDGHNDHMKRKPIKLPPATVGVAAAKRDLTKLIDEVVATGKSVTIARRGKPVVRLVVVDENRYWKWTPENAIPYDDPFWEGEKRTSAWRSQSWFRGPLRKKPK
jgi:prevent-host-death family protein